MSPTSLAIRIASLRLRKDPATPKSLQETRRGVFCNTALCAWSTGPVPDLPDHAIGRLPSGPSRLLDSTSVLESLAVSQGAERLHEPALSPLGTSAHPVLLA